MRPLSKVSKNRRGSQYIIVIADLFTSLVYVVLLGPLWSVDFAQAFLEYWFTSMDRYRHYSLIIESSILWTPSSRYVSYSRVLTCLLSHTPNILMCRSNETSGAHHPCRVTVWIVFRWSKMRKPLNSRLPTAARYTVLHLLVQLIWCSTERFQTLLCYWQYLLEEGLPLPNEELDFSYNGTQWIVSEDIYSVVKRTTNRISNGAFASFKKAKNKRQSSVMDSQARWYN